jgi:hypothetical protein
VNIESRYRSTAAPLKIVFHRIESSGLEPSDREPAAAACVL